MYPYRGIGKTESTVLVAPIGATYPQNIGGYKETFRGEILTKGRISETDIRLSDDYKAQREAAAKEIARQIEATSTANASDIDKIIKELQKAKEAKEAKDKAKKQEKTDEKADEKTKEKEQGKDKPFDLPDFCVFAKFVCDFLEQEPPAPEAPKTIPKANLSDLGLQDDIDKKRIDFTGTCPTKEMTFTLRGQTVHEAVPMYHLCNLLEKIAPWLVGFTYLSCVIFIVRSV